MTGSNIDIFERYKQRGLDARRAGQWDSARVYLLEAARVMLELSKQAKTEPLAEARRQASQKMLDLAKDCEEAKTSNRAAPTESGGQAKNSPQKAGGEKQGDDDKKDGKDWMVVEKPKIKFADVAGLEDVKSDIKLKMLYPFQFPELAKKFGIKAGGGVLFYGPPGTGKTMLAKATAGELEAAFFVVSPADIMSKWVGEAEQNIKSLFDAAKQEKRSIIFIDEIEALIPARRDDGSSVMQRVVPQILQSVQGFVENKESSVLLMGATNVPWQLDPAMLRPGRFDEKILIPLPDEPARTKILEINLGKRPCADDVDFASLAKRLQGYSGADIKYICDRAAVIPFMQAVTENDSTPNESEAAITLAILEQVITEIRPSVTDEMVARFDKWTKENQAS
jgi:transitional endoplasmic reticulum ATPase